MDLGLPEMIFIFLLALLLFGPKKLPEIGRQIGKALAEFKRASNDFKSQLEDEMRLLETEEREKKIAPPPPESKVVGRSSSDLAPVSSTEAAVAAASPDLQPGDSAHPAPGHTGVEGA